MGEAKLIAMRLGKPPAGYGRWSLQLLADELVVLEVVPSICAETVRKTLKKILPVASLCADLEDLGGSR